MFYKILMKKTECIESKWSCALSPRNSGAAAQWRITIVSLLNWNVFLSVMCYCLVKINKIYRSINHLLSPRGLFVNYQLYSNQRRLLPGCSLHKKHQIPQIRFIQEENTRQQIVATLSSTDSCTLIDGERLYRTRLGFALRVNCRVSHLFAELCLRYNARQLCWRWRPGANRELPGIRATTAKILTNLSVNYKKRILKGCENR